LKFFEELLFFFREAGRRGAAEGGGEVRTAGAERGGAAGEMPWELLAVQMGDGAKHCVVWRLNAC
jgi:hypothetical protein